MSDDSYNVDGLDKLIKALKITPPKARVGILGGKVARGDQGGQTNASIGASHEFGTEKVPRRSFLRMPISTRLNRELSKSSAFTKETMAEVIKSGTVVPWLKKVAALAEAIVIDAFATGGFGEWKPSNMANKTNAQTLVETGQLRNSITSEVKE